ncbi:hypothetical protein TruAng_001276 [Truncatella angustata]|nr:hypothetical protein TruAng_001276 [Truncatella angustata]
MSSDGHGIPDSAAQAVHQMMGHADQQQHQHELERQRSGLSDQSVDNERVFMKGAERRLSQGENTGIGGKIKESLNKLMK